MCMINKGKFMNSCQ